MDIDPTVLHVVLHLDSSTPVVAGSVEDLAGPPRVFYGWLELSSILDSIRAQNPTVAPSDDTPPTKARPSS